MALLTTEDVLSKKFHVQVPRGYDQDGSMSSLTVVSTIYSLQMENQELKEKLGAERRVAELLNSISPLCRDPNSRVRTPAVMPTFTGPQDPESATSMLALAQRVPRRYVRDGEERLRIIAEAKAFESIIADAQKQQRPQACRAGRELLEQDQRPAYLRVRYRSNLQPPRVPSSTRSAASEN